MPAVPDVLLPDISLTECGLLFDVALEREVDGGLEREVDDAMEIDVFEAQFSNMDVD